MAGIYICDDFYESPFVVRVTKKMMRTQSDELVNKKTIFLLFPSINKKRKNVEVLLHFLVPSQIIDSASSLLSSRKTVKVSR